MKHEQDTPDFDDTLMIELMDKIFPGYQDYAIDSVTPSITGQDEVISFMIVCNEEAAVDFLQTDEFSAEVVAGVSPGRKGDGQDLNLRFEFAFEYFKLQFFTTVEHSEQQAHFAQLLTEADRFIVWLVDQDKNILKIIQVNWNNETYREELEKLIQKR